MAPTICEDEHSLCNTRRTRNRITKHRNSTVISYAGRRVIDPNMFDSTTNSDSSSNSSRSDNSIIQSTSDDRTQSSVSFSVDTDVENATSSVLNSSEYRGVIERNNRQHKLQIDDDSMDSCSQSSISFHNYSKHLTEGGENDQKRLRSKSHVIDENVSQLSMQTTPSTSTSSLYDEMTYTTSTSHHQHQLTICSLPSPSSVTSTDTLPSVLMYRLTTRKHALPRRSQHRVLLEIAMKTVKLLQKNRSLQARLNQLQLETRQFVDSVMANPENCDLRNRIKYNNADDKMTVTQTFGIRH